MFAICNFGMRFLKKIRDGEGYDEKWLEKSRNGGAPASNNDPASEDGTSRPFFQGENYDDDDDSPNFVL